MFLNAHSHRLTIKKLTECDVACLGGWQALKKMQRDNSKYSLKIWSARLNCPFFRTFSRGLHFTWNFTWKKFVIFRCACQCAVLPRSLLLPMVCPPSLPRPLPVFLSMLRYIYAFFCHFTAYFTLDTELFMIYYSRLPPVCHQGGHSSLRTCHAARQGGSAEDHGPRVATKLAGLIHQFDCVFDFIFWFCHCRWAWSLCVPCSQAGYHRADSQVWEAAPMVESAWELLGGAVIEGLNWSFFLQVHFSNASPFRWSAAGPMRAALLQCCQDGGGTVDAADARRSV